MSVADYVIEFLEKQGVEHVFEDAVVERLKSRLEQSVYWQERFTLFGLSVNDVLMCEFPATINCEHVCAFPSKTASEKHFLAQ